MNRKKEMKRDIMINLNLNKNEHEMLLNAFGKKFISSKLREHLLNIAREKATN